MCAQAGLDPREHAVMELTSWMMHKHYCENDVEAVVARMTEDIHWLGAGEEEHAVGLEAVAGIFRRFAGQIPRCSISQEEYHVICLAPGAYLCTGRMWIATDPATGISLRVHQRVSLAFRWTEEGPRCCHIHISNPYGEMEEREVGFPRKMARQSSQYLREQVQRQKEQLMAQTALLRHMSYVDGLTGLYNRNKFNQVVDDDPARFRGGLGVACFDLNGLKEINDRQGHSAGDQLLCLAAEQLRKVFARRSFRTGGDEFVVIDQTLGEEEFRAAVAQVRREMEQAHISCSVGLCWRGEGCDPREQLEEADRLMYQEKRGFYRLHSSPREGR